MFQLYNFMNSSNMKVIDQKGPFRVFEHEKDLSVHPTNAVTAYFASEMNVRKRQVFVELASTGCVTQAGAMQWMSGNINTSSNVKGVSDFLGKMVSSAVTKESAVKPVYNGTGLMMLEPTYRYIILLDVSEWGTVVLDDGLFNLSLTGQGIVALESHVPREELIEVVLDNDMMKIDGNMAIA